MQICKHLFLYIPFLLLTSALIAKEQTSPKMMLKTNAPISVSFKDSLARALRKHMAVNLAKNLLDQRKAQEVMAVGAILPKLRVSASYKRNVPEVKASMGTGGGSGLDAHVAKLLRDSDDASAADEVERKAALAMRRSDAGQMVMSPKNVVEGRLSVEIPLFNGGDIAKIIKAHTGVKLQEGLVSEEKAKTIYATAKAFYMAAHLKNMVELRSQALASSEERFLKVQAQRKRGLIMEKDYLLANADVMGKKSSLRKAQLDYQTALASLGLLVGLKDQFLLEEPEELLFNMLDSDVETLIDIATKMRPDLMSAQQAVLLVERDKLGNVMQFLPSINARGDLNMTSNKNGIGGEPINFVFSINAKLSLFEGGVRFAQLRESSLRKTEAEIRLGHLKKDIELNIRGLKESLQALSLGEQAHKLKAQANAQVEILAKDRYEKGLIPQEEYLKADEDKLEAEILYKRTQAQIIEQKLALTYETGLLTPQFINYE